MRRVGLVSSVATNSETFFEPFARIISKGSDMFAVFSPVGLFETVYDLGVFVPLELFLAAEVCGAGTLWISHR